MRSSTSAAAPWSRAVTAPPAENVVNSMARMTRFIAAGCERGVLARNGLPLKELLKERRPIEGLTFVFAAQQKLQAERLTRAPLPPYKSRQESPVIDIPSTINSYQDNYKYRTTWRQRPSSKSASRTRDQSRPAGVALSFLTSALRRTRDRRRFQALPK